MNDPKTDKPDSDDPDSGYSNSELAKGLAGVVVAETSISSVDGERGLLSYRGHSIESLVQEPFLQVANLVSRALQDNSLEPAMLAARHLSPRETELVLSLPEHVHPMHVLQGVTPLLDRGDHFEHLKDLPDDARQGFVVAAKLPAVIATRYRSAAISLEGNYIDGFLKAVCADGNAPSPLLREAFNATQNLQLEHSLNASTFVARCVASTMAPVENCVAAAFGALHGVLHGGADQAALETADKVGDPAHANAFVDQCIRDGTKVMGMGHREYRVVDPRSRFVKRYAEEITRGTEHERTYETLAAIEARFNEVMQARGRSLHANLEFYKGLIYRAAGMPSQFFTTMFAMSRVFGYLAHFMESRLDNKLVRPAARYVGPPTSNLAA